MTPTAAVLSAILMCRPGLAAPVATSYAKQVVERAAKVGVDPLLVVALVDHESRWQEGAVNPKSGARGLGQVLPEYRPDCAGGKAASVACAQEKARLLVGDHNIRVTFDAIESWVKVCSAKTGSAKEERWLAAYSGLNSPKAGVMCGGKQTGGKWSPLPTPSLVKAVLDRRRALRLRLEALPPG